jgi:hypothetical protein
MANCTGRIETFRTNIYAVHDAAAAENAKRILKISQTLISSSISTVRQKAISLEQASGSDELIWIPPKTRT